MKTSGTLWVFEVRTKISRRSCDDDGKPSMRTGTQKYYQYRGCMHTSRISLWTLDEEEWSFAIRQCVTGPLARSETSTLRSEKTQDSVPVS